MFNTISNEILDLQNAIVYIDAGHVTGKYSSDEDRLASLSQMNLMVFLITERFFEAGCKARTLEFDYAVKNRIPVLPILLQEGIEEIFNRVCGPFHLLNRYSFDYNEKLKHFIDLKFNQYHMLGKPPITLENCKNSKIFISYRKKDRVYADNAIRLIRSIEFLRDVEIWYDDFLTEGEEYNEEIDKHLKESDLFLLIVTPALLEDGNYVMRIEYPNAVRSGKMIIPLIMENTDIEQLKEKYDGIGPFLRADDKAEINRVFAYTLSAMGKPAEKYPYSPEKLFMLGSAYLDGKGMESNPSLGIEMLADSSDGGCSYACSRLGMLFADGIGVPVDHEKACFFFAKAAELSERDFLADPPKDSELSLYLNSHATLLERLCDSCLMCGKTASAKSVLLRRREVLKALHSDPQIYSSRNTVGENEFRLGKLYHEEKDYDNALKCYSEAEQDILKYERSTDQIRYKITALDFYECCGELYAEMGKNSSDIRFRRLAVECLNQAFHRIRFFNREYRKNYDVTRKITQEYIAAAFALGEAGDPDSEANVYIMLHNEYIAVCNETHYDSDYSTLAQLKLNLAVLAKPDNSYDLLCQAAGIWQSLLEDHPDNEVYSCNFTIAKNYIEKWNNG